MSAPTERYLPIDEEGYFIFDSRRVDDEDLGRKLLENIERVETNRFVTSIEGQQAWIEAVDEPLVARHVQAANVPGVFIIDLPYRTQMRFSLDTLCIDEWDRFHGLTERQIPFVFSRTAQFEFFDLLESFDDESVTVQGKTYQTPPWLLPSREPDGSAFWTNIYKNSEPAWEQGRESVALPAILPQLKLNKARVLVLGAGTGHDAAYFAKQGHMVTAVDFSEEAVQRMRKNYSELDTLKIVQADVFNLPKEWTGRFDLIFEHTCYCAVAPDRRNELMAVWKRVLAPHGDLLGVFFVNEKRSGPPWGGSEWELRERLGGSFDFLFWTRWRQSVEERKSKEIVIYARKKT